MNIVNAPLSNFFSAIESVVYNSPFKSAPV